MYIPKLPKRMAQRSIWEKEPKAMLLLHMYAYIYIYIYSHGLNIYQNFSPGAAESVPKYGGFAVPCDQ